MGTLVLLLFLSVGPATWLVAEAQPLFTIKSVTLSLEPGSDVARDANVTVRCHVDVSTSSGTSLSRSYVLYKDGTVAYAKNTSSPDDLLYPLAHARVTNTGKYKCQVTIQDKTASSGAEKLTVTGLSKPILHLSKHMFSEGEQVTARCSAPGETGPFVFYFFENDKEMHDEMVNSNEVEVPLRFSTVGPASVHCAYTVIMVPDSVRSDSSNTTVVTVKELSFAPVLQISPESRIYEGDRMNISCTVAGSIRNTSDLKLYLSNGDQLLKVGTTKASHSMVALSNNSGNFECSLEMGNQSPLKKRAMETVKVNEIISTPVLKMDQSEVFEHDRFRLKCHSAILSSERVNFGDVRYEILKDDALSGVRADQFPDTIYTAGTHTYTCRAEARNIVKDSPKFIVQVKALASPPRISALSRVVVGRPFRVRCSSDRGSLPIVHTLWKKDVPTAVGMYTVREYHHQALFNLTIKRPEEIGDYYCKSENNRRVGPVTGARLNVSVVVPLTSPLMTVLPPDVVEGDQLYLICGVRGTPPVTFKWFHNGKPMFNVANSSRSSETHQIAAVDERHSGSYHCEAVNYANVVVCSQAVTVKVKMALWKSSLIVVSCLLMILVAALLCMLRFKARRGRREAAAELSVKPSSPKSDDSLTMSLTHDTEVYNEPKDAVPGFDGMEGRVTNGMRDSVTSLPADISNRSSFSIPATV